jgi:hypothetical protein
MTAPLLVAVEGDTDEPFARALVESAGRSVDHVVVLNGHGQIDRRLRRWCLPSNRRPMLVLRDFDPALGATCPAELIANLIGDIEPSPTTLVRMPVREMEAWMLADREAASSFFQTPILNFPTSPDDDPDPKRTLVDLCRKSSSPDIRDGMVPDPGAGRAVGRRFTGLVLEFGRQYWNPERAAAVSPSLAKALVALS